MAAVKSGQPFVNTIAEQVRAFGYVTGLWKPLVELSDNLLLTNWQIRNTLDAEVEIMLCDASTTIILAPNESFILDGFVHGFHTAGGITVSYMQIRATGGVPGAGEIKTRHW